MSYQHAAAERCSGAAEKVKGDARAFADVCQCAEAESLHVGAKIRPARVAIVLSKATDYNESQLNVPKALDPFVSRCDNGPEQINQIICRKDQQMLYLALRHAQFGVELVTEDDIVDLDVLVISVSADLENFLTVKGVLQSVSEENGERETVSHLVGTGTGAGSVHSTELCQ